MNIALVDEDGLNFPNLALMKIAAFHKYNGDKVSFFNPLFDHPDAVYSSKVFTFTPEYKYFPTDASIFHGGTGHDIKSSLGGMDCMEPDYSIYPELFCAIGFLSRGCIRKCPWCIVPQKEGNIRRYDNIERISQGRKHIVLMDNNFLANDFEFIREQLEKAIRNNFYLDFNQGLDARLVTPEIAALLAKCKWKAYNGNNGYIRFSCDTKEMLPYIQNAVVLLRKFNYKGGIFIYVLAKEVHETLSRIEALLKIDKKIIPFCQPYRDFDNGGDIHDPELKRLARWCNRVWIRKSCSFKDYKG